jgi:hypothetical protein
MIRTVVTNVTYARDTFEGNWGSEWFQQVTWRYSPQSKLFITAAVRTSNPTIFFWVVTPLSAHCCSTKFSRLSIPKLHVVVFSELLKLMRLGLRSTAFWDVDTCRRRLQFSSKRGTYQLNYTVPHPTRHVRTSNPAKLDMSEEVWFQHPPVEITTRFMSAFWITFHVTWYDQVYAIWHNYYDSQRGRPTLPLVCAYLSPPDFSGPPMYSLLQQPQQQSGITTAKNSMRIQDHEQTTSHRIPLLLCLFVSDAYHQIT